MVLSASSVGSRIESASRNPVRSHPALGVARAIPAGKMALRVLFLFEEAVMPRRYVDAKRRMLDSRDYKCGRVVDGKCLKHFGGPERVRTVDLFHALVSKSIGYRQFHKKHESYAPVIWASFGPHALFHVGLDLVRSSFPGSW